MILKSYIVEGNVKTLSGYQSTLMYGENIGLKEDIKDNVKKIYSNYEFINLFEEEIIKNKDLLFNNISNSSLFAEKKIIFIQEASDKIYPQISEILEDELNDIRIYIIAGMLDKKSKLRNYFEKSENKAIFACYKDTERTLINYINQELKKYKGLTPSITNEIISNSNLDRKIIKNEIKKIIDFFGNRELKQNEIRELLNIKSNSEFNELRDAALAGDKNKINKLLGQIDFAQENLFYYLNNISHRIKGLIEIHEIDKKNKNLEISIEQLKPKIFWKDKPNYTKQLLRWDKNNLQEIFKNINKIEVLMKKNADIKNDILLKNLLVNICEKKIISYAIN